MKIFLVGGTGFVGTALIDKLLAAGHGVTTLARSEKKAAQLPESVRVVAGDPSRPGNWQESVKEADTVINLAGFNIFNRWTEKTKQRIRDSRILSTRNIVEAISPASSREQTLLNASAAGYFGFCGDEPRYEADPPGSDFLARVCLDWENEAFRARDKGARVIAVRLAVVLGKHDGALAKMLPGFRLGLGGRLGHGRQWFSWIHVDDLTDIFLFLLGKSEISGPVNCGAPNPVRNSEFTKALGAVLHRPTFFSVPRFVVSTVLGELGSVVLEGNRMLPGVLVREGFSFCYPEINGALKQLFAP